MSDDTIRRWEIRKCRYCDISHWMAFDPHGQGQAFLTWADALEYVGRSAA